jgi:mRNA interferase MazF
MALQQGEVIWAALPQPYGRRPVVVLTRDAAVNKLNRVTVALCTRTIRKVPTEVILEPVDGLPTTCAASLDSILTLDRTLLAGRIATLSNTKMAAIFAAIRVAFDML